jgi:hypothetical protein
LKRISPARPADALLQPLGSGNADERGKADETGNTFAASFAAGATIFDAGTSMMDVLGVTGVMLESAAVLGSGTSGNLRLFAINVVAGVADA